MYWKKSKQLILLTLTLVIVGCGWQLRGTTLGIAIEWTVLEYESELSNQLSRTLERALSKRTSDEEAEYLLIVVNEMPLERTLSVTDALYTDQLRMEKRVQYRISAINGGRIETGTAYTWRDLEVDNANPAATEREKAFLQSEIDAEIVQQLLRHLERFSINNLGDLPIEKREQVSASQG